MSADPTDPIAYRTRLVASLAAEGMTIPPVPRPLPSFVPWRQSDGRLFLSGQACLSNGVATWAEPIGPNEFEALDDALTVAALNLVAAVVDAVGETEAIPKAWLQLRIFVRTNDGVGSEPIERVTSLLHSLVPEGSEKISPTVVGVVQLPLQASVTIDGILALH